MLKSVCRRSSLSPTLHKIKKNPSTKIHRFLTLFFSTLNLHEKPLTSWTDNPKQQPCNTRQHTHATQPSSVHHSLTIKRSHGSSSSRSFSRSWWPWRERGPACLRWGLREPGRGRWRAWSQAEWKPSTGCRRTGWPASCPVGCSPPWRWPPPRLARDYCKTAQMSVTGLKESVLGTKGLLCVAVKVMVTLAVLIVPEKIFPLFLLSNYLSEANDWFSISWMAVVVIMI